MGIIPTAIDLKVLIRKEKLTLVSKYMSKTIPKCILSLK
jgi:hypothetical protein